MTVFKSPCGCEFQPFALSPHVHSDQSLDGASSVAKIVKRAKELGLKHVVLTEHGNLNSAAALAMAASKEKLSYSHGMEVYLDNPLKLPEEEDQSYVHLTILFKTQKAYEYFCRLTPVMESRAAIKWGERKPIIKWCELEEIGSELIIGSGCLVGFIQRFVLNGDIARATRAYEMCRSIVQPGCFFVELFPHEVTHNWEKPKREKNTNIITEPGYFKPNECCPECHNDIQRKPNQFVIEMARKYGDPILVSEDSHFASPNQKVVQDGKLGNGSEAWKFYTSYHMRDPAEYFQVLNHIYGISAVEMGGIIENSYLIANLLKDYKFLTSKDRWVLPVFDGNTREHLINLIKKHGRMPKGDPRYIERLKMEVGVLTKNSVADFLPYIFQVEELSDWARNNDVLMNLRGSAGGSLIFYLIGASITDPIKYNLPFERFITLGRIDSGALPDADCDFSNKPKMMGYLHETCGVRYAPLSINLNLKVKTSIKDAERALLGKVRPETKRLCVSLPGIPQGVPDHDWLFGYVDKDTGEHIDGYWDKSEDLRKYAHSNPEIWTMVLECMGVMRNKGSHACGGLITPEPVCNYFPLTWVGTKDSGQMCVGFDPKTLEFAGGVKIDILGVQTLEAIRLTNSLIKERGGTPLVWNEYPHDPAVYRDIFWTGNTSGVFQFNTPLVKPYLKKIHPKSTADLSAITALCRPGTLDAPCALADGRSNAEYYVDVAMGKEQPFYVHPDLELILRETNSILIYQEQFLQIFRDLGGYTYETAEVVRRAVGKKDKATIELHLENLKQSLLRCGWTDAQCKALSEQMLASCRYSFNKSHSQSYSLVGYNTAYLKKNFPIEFWTAELTVFGGVEEKLKAYTQEIGHLILQPSISHSAAYEWKIEGTKIRAPLSVIKGLGPAATKAIVESAPYSSVVDFAERCNSRAVNRGTFLKLVFAGLFDDFGIPYEKMVAAYWVAKKIKDEIPVEVFNDDRMERFLRRIELNMLTSESLVSVMKDVLVAKGWQEVPGRMVTPFVKDGAPLIANVQYAAKALDKKFTDSVGMVVIYKSSEIATTKNGKRFLKVKLSDGSIDFEAVDWNSMVTLHFPANSVVLVKGVLKPGYKMPVSINMSHIEKL